MTTSINNPYSDLELGRNDVFKVFEDYEEPPAATRLLLNIKNCLMRNEDAEDRLHEICASILPTESILTPRSKYVALYEDIRTAMTTYDISCVTKLPNEWNSNLEKADPYDLTQGRRRYLRGCINERGTK